MARSGLFHVRIMDDILVLSPTPWSLRWAVTVAAFREAVVMLKREDEL